VPIPRSSLGWHVKCWLSSVEMRVPKLVSTLVVVLFSIGGGVVSAQEGGPEPAGVNRPAVSRIFASTKDVFAQPLHPLIDTIASGGWVGAGLGYDPPTPERWRVSSKGLVTLHRYWLAEFEGGYTGDRLEAVGYARTRSMKRLNFFGVGADSEVADRTSFTLRDPLVGVVASTRMARGLSVGGRVEQMWPAVDSGEDPRYPTIEQRFTDADAPGLSEQPRFGRYEAFVEAAVPPSDGRSFNQGGVYRVSYDVYDDQELDQFDFERLQLEGRHRFAMPHPYHSLTLRGWLSSAAPMSGREVPFFLQHTLGGTSNIRSVYDAPVGGDKTAATLRAFPSHRYRDNHLLLLQAEYRWSPWGPIETTLFAEGGQVAHRFSELDLSRLQTSYGFSVSLMRGANAVARVDVGFGGGEGSRLFFDMGGWLR
jgi:hypothetical protein